MSKTGTNKSKGKTYEDIYGIEKAAELKELRRKDFKIRRRNPEWNIKISEAAKKRVGDRNPFYGRTHSTETRENLSKIRREKYLERQTVNKQARRYWRVEAWRKLVFERDSYCCQFCGIHNYSGLGKTVKLHAHHILHLSEIIGDRTFEEVIKDPRLYEINNGVTLCLNCHKKVHARNSND